MINTSFQLKEKQKNIYTINYIARTTFQLNGKGLIESSLHYQQVHFDGSLFFINARGFHPSFITFFIYTKF